MANYDILISYDIEKKNEVHSFVKTCMEGKGYFDAFIFTDEERKKRIVRLPNTTLWKKNTIVQLGYTDMTDCLNQYSKKTSTNYELEKCIVIQFTGAWWAMTQIATADEIRKYPER